MTVDDPVRAGQAVYTPRTLKIYDWVVLGFSNHLIWRCPTARLRALYDRNISNHHLDIGVGTGYFLDRARWPDGKPHVTLVDLNQNSLDAAAHRIARLHPVSVRANALEPLPVKGPFRSIGACYLLHCLPGTMEEKAAVFDHVVPLLAGDGVLFGATIVRDHATWAAKALMRAYNRRGIFSNETDTQESLDRELRKRFADVRLKRHGNVVLFEARLKPAIASAAVLAA